MSGDSQFCTFLDTFSNSGPTVADNGSADQWNNFPLVCNLRSHFAVLTVSDVEAQLLDDLLEYDVLRRATLTWVAGLWDRFRDVRELDEGHSSETFLKTITYILYNI